MNQEIPQYNKSVNANYSRPGIDANIIQIRLDTQKLLEKIELFLKGSREVYSKDETGQIIVQHLKVGEPKANDEGIQSLLNWLNGTINAQVVQGNFPSTSSGDSPAYNRYIKEYHIELTELLILNIYNWGIKEGEINGIISFIMLLVQPFFSRLIGNKERESYSESLRSEERTKKWGLI